MSSFFQNLSDRERIIVMAGGVIFALVILIQLIMMPILNWRADQADRARDAQGLYRLMAEAAPMAQSAGDTSVDNSLPIRNAVSQSASAAGVELVFVNARPDGAVDANITSADPTALYQWLQRARDEFGLVIISADIARENGNPSSVRAQLTFNRQAG